MVGAVIAALKLKFKQNGDEHYNPLTSDEEGRVALTSAPLTSTHYHHQEQDEASIALLGSETRPRRKRKHGCCVCCGLECVYHDHLRLTIKKPRTFSCSLFWKVAGIVVAGLAIWSSVKLILWAVSDAPTGLDRMPAFSTSLGCLAAPYIYNNSKVDVMVPIGSEGDHSFDFRGSAVGTVLIAQGTPDLQSVRYEMTIRAANETFLDLIHLKTPDLDGDGSVQNSHLVISAPRTGADAGCIRFDIVMYIPPTLRKLHLVSHATTHVQFASNADIELESFYVTLFAMDENNLILPSQTVRGEDMALELIRGWIVGDVAIMNSTSISTQRGDGVTNVRAHPVPSNSQDHPSPVTFRTTTGAGRSDIFYIGSASFKRQIDNVHMSSRNGDVYLTYKEAEFSGRISLDSKSYTTVGLRRFPDAPNKNVGRAWTHWAGNEDGRDTVYVRSGGWSGLYF
ncbi:hypothetical protein H0H93_008293 [Arthromyces matolae]|nr:hypothetical protein H0H93_008293 [Arthromyces matolae]